MIEQTLVNTKNHKHLERLINKELSDIARPVEENNHIIAGTYKIKVLTSKFYESL